jgi:hypothetical protein
VRRINDYLLFIYLLLLFVLFPMQVGGGAYFCGQGNYKIMKKQLTGGSGLFQLSNDNFYGLLTGVGLAN